MQILNNVISGSIIALVLVSSVSLAQEESESAAEAAPQTMRGMSAEERRAAFELLSDEEKQAVRKRRREVREKQRAEWQAMTPTTREPKR